MNKTIFLFVPLLLAGCHKPSDQPTFLTPGPLYAIPAEMKEWTMFKPGSYWIYKNESTGESDSSTQKYGPYFEEIPCRNCPVRQEMWFFAASPVYAKFELHGGADSNAVLWITTRDHRVTDILTYYTLVHPDASSNTSDYLETYKCLGVLDNFVLNDNTFMHVIVTSLAGTNYSDPDRYLESYFARNIGLIKFTQRSKNSDTTWSLIRWHTVQ